MNILLDPYILAVPEQAERAEAYMERLDAWMDAVNSNTNKHRYWLSSSVLDALFDAKRYPTWQVLAELEESLPPDRTYNPNTLLRACEAQLTMPPLLDDLCANTTLYYESDQASVIPLAIAARLPAGVSRALQETLISAAIGSNLRCHAVYDDLVFGTAPDGFHETELGVDVLAQHIDTQQTVPITQTWTMVFSPQQLDELGGLASFWHDTQRAVAWMYRTLQAPDVSGDASQTLPKIVAGRAFNASIYDLHFDTMPGALAQLFKKVIFASVGVIPRYITTKGKGDKKNHHHPLRAGNDQIVREDGAAAWRLHIYASCRLHYWLLPDGTIELSKVCIHEDYTIE